MHPNEIKSWIKDIKSHKDDPERAHAMEDEMFQEVLNVISIGAFANGVTPQILAEEALKSKKIKFSRHTA